MNKRFRPHIRMIDGFRYLILSSRELQNLLEKYPEDQHRHVILAR